MSEQEAVVYTAHIGIDWANSKHDVCVQKAGSGKREFDVVQHRAEVIDAWVQGLHTRFGGTIAVAVELSKGQLYRLYRSMTLLIFSPSIQVHWLNIEKPSSPVKPKTIPPMQSLPSICCSDTQAGLHV